MTLDVDFRQCMTLPAVCAPMTMVSGPALVREACRSGIMGALPRHNARTRAEFESWLASIRQDLDAYASEHPAARVGPLAVNIIARQPATEIRDDLEICARYGVKIIISALGNPTELARIAHDWGGRVFHDVTNLRFAAKAIEAGVDGLTCIGSGGGGHSGTLNALAFIPRVREMWEGTIVFAGGVSSGAAIRAAEVLGADLAYLGTRFIATQESAAPDAYKASLVSDGSEDLIYTDRVSGVPANWLKSSLRRMGLDPDDLPTPISGRRYEHLPAGARPWRQIWSAGQGIDLIHDIPSVAELVLRLRREYVAACATPGHSWTARLGERETFAINMDAGVDNS
jgi:nitronate monooxygenase